MVKLLAQSAPAKINLFLRVTGRRGDGYHLIDSIFVPVSLADHLRVEIRPARELAVSLRCNAAAIGPEDRNLAVRAARAFAVEFGLRAAIGIDLEKRIPAGAGLGGGSSDAAAVLRIMAALERVNEPAHLARLALELGADVPFFLDPRPARVRGVGELVTPMDRLRRLDLAIAVPPVAVATSEIFAALAPREWSGSAPETDVEAIARGEVAAALMVNDLAAPAMRLYPEIARLKAALERSGALAAAMSGSGGAAFGIFESSRAAERGAQAVRTAIPEASVFAAKTLEGPGG